MKKILFALTAMAILLNGCRSAQDAAIIVSALNAPGSEAVSPYFTKNNKGNAVLCWAEKSNTDSTYRLKYAVYNINTGLFNAAVTVAGSEDVNTSPEGMGKIAFKSDGTVMAVFGKRFINEKNPFAGAIFFNSSEDNGKSWSKPQFLHSDTSHAYGRGFFDITTLKDGELGAIWLDSRYGKAIKGSALFFARTAKGRGFEKDTCLAKGTCECCRTDIVTDKNGNIHIAYRNIIFPDALLGKQVRDMAYSFSTDNGKTFSPAKTISQDNWAIEGCPHSGPSLAITKNAVNAVWFTGGGTSGLYYTSMEDKKTAFKKRTLISASGRHPQMISLPDEHKLVMVCEEASEVSEETKNMDHSMAGMTMQHSPAIGARIILRSLKNGRQDKEVMITDGHQADHHAVLTNVSGNLLVAWIREDKGRSTICFSQLNKENL